MTDIVHVAVAVIMNESDQVCISLRHKDLHQGGLWEFPGGKIEQGESVEQALKREIKEELNLSVVTSRPLIEIFYNYPGVKVCLHVRKVQSYRGQVVNVEGQMLKWVGLSQLLDYDFPAANTAIITAIQLPECYLITGKFTDQENFINKLKCALKNNIRLVQLRLKNNNFPQVNDPQKFIHEVSLMCEQAGAELLFNLSEKWMSKINFEKISFSGFHADSKLLMGFFKRPKGRLFSASCHTDEELKQALQLQADFVVLSPVQKTSSHPDMIPIGWKKFSALTKKMSVPVYALGGVSEADLYVAQEHGGQGIAAISAFWKE